MEAAKPKRKHKKKAKNTALRSAEDHEESQDSKENAVSTFPEAETIHTAGTSESASSGPVADDSEKSDLRSTSEQSEELMRKLAEFMANAESVASIKEELENIPQVLSGPQNETGRDKNKGELENLDGDHETTGNVDTSEILNTVEIDSRTPVAPNQDDHATEVQSVSMTPESSSVTETQTSCESKTLDGHATEAQSVSMMSEFSSLAETQASGESETLAVKQDEPVVRRDIHEGLKTTEDSDITENFNLISTRESAVEENAQNLSPQVTADETPMCVTSEDSRTSQMYPNMDSVARESVSSTCLRKYRITLEAFSEDRLKTLYFNPLLEQMEGFVEHFLRAFQRNVIHAHQLNHGKTVWRTVNFSSVKGCILKCLQRIFLVFLWFVQSSEHGISRLSNMLNFAPRRKCAMKHAVSVR